MLVVPVAVGICFPFPAEEELAHVAGGVPFIAECRPLTKGTLLVEDRPLAQRPASGAVVGATVEVVNVPPHDAFVFQQIVDALDEHLHLGKLSVFVLRADPTRWQHVHEFERRLLVHIRTILGSFIIAWRGVRPAGLAQHPFRERVVRAAVTDVDHTFRRDVGRAHRVDALLRVPLGHPGQVVQAEDLLTRFRFIVTVLANQLLVGSVVRAKGVQQQLKPCRVLHLAQLFRSRPIEHESDDAFQILALRNEPVDGRFDHGCFPRPSTGEEERQVAATVHGALLVFIQAHHCEPLASDLPDPCLIGEQAAFHATEEACKPFTDLLRRFVQHRRELAAERLHLLTRGRTIVLARRRHEADELRRLEHDAFGCEFEELAENSRCLAF
mmetsp:Transcript_25252/g.64023  ORF Transcript_25252/g.64023 Transcript_25252/m.64023 type:complete len:384 (-) Transcript_25252:1112-2263(-)